MNLRMSRAPIVRAAVLVGGLCLLAIADGRDVLGQPVVRDHRSPATTTTTTPKITDHRDKDPKVTDHRKPKETRPGYVWTGTHWERVQAPKPVVPPPAVGPKPTPRPSGPPVVSGGTEISRCRADQIKCNATCPVSVWALSGPVGCGLICADKYDVCRTRGR